MLDFKRQTDDSTAPLGEIHLQARPLNGDSVGPRILAWWLGSRLLREQTFCNPRVGAIIDVAKI